MATTQTTTKTKDTTYKSPYETASKTQQALAGVAAALSPKEAERQRMEAERAERERCLANGGRWDDATKSCILPQVKTQAPATAQAPEGQYSKERGGFVTNTGQLFPTTNPDFRPSAPDRTTKFNADGTVTLTGADEKPVTLSKEEYKTFLGSSGNVTANIQEAQMQPNIAQQEALGLAGQVGQVQQLGVSPTGLDFGQAATQGIVGAIPRALSLAAAGAGVGLLGGGAAGSVVPVAGTAIGAGTGAAIGAIGGFVAGISSSIISDLKRQRTDTTNAQKKVLTEGKQSLKDWATLAEADPANKALYVAEYNKVSAQIDRAYRQMRLDTSRDLAKFETAIPDLAEFEAFYSAGGERDILNLEMRNALINPVSSEYKMLELSQRRKV